MTAGAPDTLVVHPGGALGDFVLTWPLLRSLRGLGRRVEVVSADSRARLARRVLGVGSRPDHLPPWTGLWTGMAPPASEFEAVTLVLAFGERPEPWRRAMAMLCPRAVLEVVDGALDRPLALELGRRFGAAAAHGPRAGNPRGPVLLHAGAGSPDKCWPLEGWIGLARELRGRGISPELRAGEVEAERWGRERTDRFLGAGGRFLATLDDLVDGVQAARAVVSGDTGPGHLAAQLGLPTLTLFGPTDPARWRPIGPCSDVLSAPGSRLEGLRADHVLSALDALLSASETLA